VSGVSARDWNENYATESTPWDSGEPDPHLVELVESGELEPGRLLEIGCGTGTNAIWLAERGFDVTAFDVAPLAIEKAGTKAGAAGSHARFLVHDVLAAPAPGGPYDLVFDRGVFHVFDDAADRARFAERVAEALRVGGRWLSLAGSTEGPARDHGPPRRSARDLVGAAEPHLAIVGLRASEFSDDLPSTVLAWVLLARRREIPAQPSARRVAEL
jgi:SAM-dependent methyltransferase